MAEETTARPGDVSSDDTAQAPAPEATEQQNTEEPASEPVEESPDIRFALANDTAGKASSGNENQEGAIPSWRLKEESERRRAAEAQLAQTQQMMSGMINQQRVPAQQNPAQETEEEKLRRSFGSEEDGGPQAYEAVRNVSEFTTRQLIDQAKTELRQEMRGEVDRRVGGVTASISTSQELSDLKASGYIDDAAEQEIGRRMAAAITENPAWGESNNQPFLLSKVYLTMLQGGELRPGVTPSSPATPSGNGNSMHQPGGGGQRLTTRQRQENKDTQLKEMQKQFPKKLGNMSMDQLRNLYTDAVGDTEGQQQGFAAPPGTTAYVHRR